MASLINDPGGRRRIVFQDRHGKRHTIYLGKMAKRQAGVVKMHVEDLVAAQQTRGAPSDGTTRWLSEISDTLHDKLAAKDLVPRRESCSLEQFISQYVNERTDLKPRTITKYNATKNYLVGFYGKDCSLRSLVPGDADRWRLHLIQKRLAENTVRKHIAVAKVLFNAAVRKKLIDSSPFTDLKSTIQPNPERFHFVTREEADKVIDACPDSLWRLIFALSRYGGLRCPSEHLALTWDCVDWENNRLRVPSSKTEHHAGRSYRIIPLFPELRPFLQEVFTLAEEGSEHVITRYRDTNCNLRTQLQRIIRRAGLQPWPKLFQNLRSTRQTELAGEFPQHVVCDWIGNTNAVAAKHYLQVTDEHFQQAARQTAQQESAGERSEVKSKKVESQQGDT